MRTRPELQGCGPDRKYASPSNLSGLMRTQRNRTAVILGWFALSLLLLTACEKKEEKPKPGPPEVLVAEVVQQDVPIFEEWVAQLNGPVNAEITPKVQGYLLKQNYQNGYFVKKGQLLFELDPRQYEAAARPGQGGGGSRASESGSRTQPTCTAILRWPRKMRFHKSNSTPISPIRPPARREVQAKQGRMCRMRN